MTINGFTNRLFTLERKIDHLKRRHATSRSESEIFQGPAYDLNKLRHDLNHLMEINDEIRTEVYLRFKRKSNRFQCVKVHMDTVPGNAQLLNG